LKSRIERVLIGAILCLLSVSSPAWIESSEVERHVETAPVMAEVRSAPEPAKAAGPIDMAAAEAAGVSSDILTLALGAVACATSSGEIAPPPTLTLIDYSLPSVKPRLWVFDMDSGKILFKELVAHGRNTGENIATRFSDAMNSHASSLGLFVTRDTYVGRNGYSLRLDGLEPGFNGRARERAIVMHGSRYVSAESAARLGRIGRSWGCPALGEAVARKVINTVRGGGVIFSYYPDSAWLKRSRFLNGCEAVAAD
jgi:hypothetical protein